MTDDLHAFWQAYIGQLAAMYGLKDWDIQLKRDRPGRDCGADCVIWYGQRRVSIRLAVDPFDSHAKHLRHEQRRMVLHELTHCHVEFADEAVRLACKDAEDPRNDLFREYYQRASELSVDSIATAIAPLFPLPGELTGDDREEGAA